MQINEHLGNTEILKVYKTSFLCSRKVPASVVLKCYDWAIAQREAGNCIISGFHSQLEKDVLHYLLKGKQPIILAMARGIKKQLEPGLTAAIQEGRLLVVSPFGPEITRITQETSQVRNQMMIELADQIVVGHMSQGGLLEKALFSSTKPIVTL